MGVYRLAGRLGAARNAGRPVDGPACVALGMTVVRCSGDGCRQAVDDSITARYLTINYVFRLLG